MLSRVLLAASPDSIRCRPCPTTQTGLRNINRFIRPFVRCAPRASHCRRHRRIRHLACRVLHVHRCAILHPHPAVLRSPRLASEECRLGCNVLWNLVHNGEVRGDGTDTHPGGLDAVCCECMLLELLGHLDVFAGRTSV